MKDPSCATAGCPGGTTGRRRVSIIRVAPERRHLDPPTRCASAQQRPRPGPHRRHRGAVASSTAAAAARSGAGHRCGKDMAQRRARAFSAWPSGNHCCKVSGAWGANSDASHLFVHPDLVCGRRGLAGQEQEKRRKRQEAEHGCAGVGRVGQASGARLCGERTDLLALAFFLAGKRFARGICFAQFCSLAGASIN